MNKDANKKYKSSLEVILEEDDSIEEDEEEDII